MSKHREAYEAWKKLVKYCNDSDCDTCIEIQKRIAELEQGEQ